MQRSPQQSEIAIPYTTPEQGKCNCLANCAVAELMLTSLFQ